MQRGDRVPRLEAHAGARATLLRELGLRRYAYDYRPEHIPTFDREVEVMKAAGIEITAWWFPTTLNDTAHTILAVIERQGIKPDLWVQGGPGGPVRTPPNRPPACRPR